MAFHRCLMLVCGIVLLGQSGVARAESTQDFLKSLSGTWRGSGSVYISEKSKNAPVRCKITSTLNEQRKKLRNRGRCATAQRKTRVSGSIGYSATDKKLTGSYFNALGDFTITGSSGSLSGSTMTLITTVQKKQSGKVSRIRNVVRRVSKRKFKIAIYEKIGGSYKRRGSITFTK